MDSLLVWFDAPWDDVNVRCGDCVCGDWCNHTWQSAGGPSSRENITTEGNTTLKETNGSKTIEVATI